MGRELKIIFTLPVPGIPPDSASDKATLVNPYAEGTEEHRVWAQGYEAAGFHMFLQMGIGRLEHFLEKYRTADGHMQPAQFTYGEMCRGKDKFMRGAMEGVMEWLRMQGMVRVQQTQPSSRGGRPTRIYHIAEDFPSAEDMPQLWARLEREVHIARQEASADPQDQQETEFTPGEAARA